MAGGPGEVDDVYVPVIRLTPALGSSVGWKILLDTEDDLTMK